MKNGVPYEALLPEELTEHLDFYVEHARPVLQARSNESDAGWLWLGLRALE
jgi:hypothetical protein